MDWLIKYKYWIIAGAFFILPALAKFASRSINDWYGRAHLRLSFRQQVDFLEDALLLHADGIPLRDAFSQLEKSGLVVYEAGARWMSRRLKEGASFAEAMKGLFRFHIVGAVDAAAQVDLVAHAGAIIARLREQQAGRSDAFVAFFSGLVYLAAALGINALFSAWVWPRFQTPGINPEDVAWTIRVAQPVGDFVVEWWWATIVLTVLMAVGTWQLLRAWSGIGRKWLDQWAFKLYREVRAASTLEELGILLLGGIDVKAALGTIAEHASPHVRMYVNEMIDGLDRGKDLAGALDVRFVRGPDMAHLRALVQHGDFTNAIARTGAASRRAVRKKVGLTMVAIQTLCKLILGLTLMAMIYGMYETSDRIRASAERSMQTSIHWQHTEGRNATFT